MREINFLRSYCNNFQHAIILRIILRLPLILTMDFLLISNFDAILRLWEVWERSGLWQIWARQIPVSKQFQQKIPFPWSASSSQERLLGHLHDGQINLLHPVVTVLSVTITFLHNNFQNFPLTSKLLNL